MIGRRGEVSGVGLGTPSHNVSEATPLRIGEEVRSKRLLVSEGVEVCLVGG